MAASAAGHKAAASAWRAPAAALDAIAAVRGKRTVLRVTHRPECEVVADRAIVLG